MLALIVASVGLYGVASYMVAQPTNEIGIRMALGAQRRDVVAMMLRSAMRPAAAGLLIGLGTALAGGRLIASQLYGVKSHDQWVIGGAVIAVSLCALLAAVIPARRAASIDPMQALRTE